MLACLDLRRAVSRSAWTADRFPCGLRSAATMTGACYDDGLVYWVGILAYEMNDFNVLSKTDWHM